MAGAASRPIRKADATPLDNNPIDSFTMDRHKTDTSGVTAYWVRGGELYNLWIAHYEPDSREFEQEEGSELTLSVEISFNGAPFAVGGEIIVETPSG